VKKLRRYDVREFMTAWSDWQVEATSKADAIERVKRGEAATNFSTSDSSGPNGRYLVWPALDNVIGTEMEAGQ
jgi:hypothetical protein